MTCFVNGTQATPVVYDEAIATEAEELYPALSWGGNTYEVEIQFLPQVPLVDPLFQVKEAH